MKTVFPLMVLTLILQGCGGIKTKQIYFYADPSANRGVEILVNVVYVYPHTTHLETEILKLGGPTDWFSKHSMYNEVVKDVFNVHPGAAGGGPNRVCMVHQLNREYRRNASGVFIIAEYGKYQPHPSSRAIVYLHKKLESEPKPKGVEHIFIGQGYLKRQKRSWFLGRMKDIYPKGGPLGQRTGGY